MDPIDSLISALEEHYAAHARVVSAESLPDTRSGNEEREGAVNMLGAARIMLRDALAELGITGQPGPSEEVPAP